MPRRSVGSICDSRRVDQRHATQPGNAGDDLRLADAGRPPQHHRRVLAGVATDEFAVEDGFDMGGTHDVF
jgi:hypothetical protein